jgi:hypothetical protein
MDKIRFPYVSLDSSIADVHAHAERLVLVVKTAIVSEDCTTEEQRSVVRFSWAKGLSAKDINKEMFPVYGAKCCRVKQFTTGWQIFADGEEVDIELWK